MEYLTCLQWLKSTQKVLDKDTHYAKIWIASHLLDINSSFNYLMNFMYHHPCPINGNGNLYCYFNYRKYKVLRLSADKQRLVIRGFWVGVENTTSGLTLEKSEEIEVYPEQCSSFVST